MTNRFNCLLENSDQGLVRAMSLHYWPEEINLEDCSNLLVSAISLLDLWPVKALLFRDVFARQKSKNWKTKEDIMLADLQSRGKVIIEPKNQLSGGRSKTNSGFISISLNDGSFSGEMFFQHSTDVLTIDLSLKIISTLLVAITPRYGFSSIGSGDYLMQLHSGQPSSSDDQTSLKRLRAHEAVRHCEPHEDGYLGKRLLDIFELNILSSEHLKSRVFDTSLEDWIASGNRGTLTQLKKDVYAWVVPDEMRPNIRQNMLRAKHLVVPV